MDLAIILQNFNFEKALDAYLKALNLMTTVTVQVYNNIAVLYTGLAKYEDALKYLIVCLGNRPPTEVASEFEQYKRDKEAVGQSVEPDHIMNGVHITVLFNCARNYEYLGERDNAMNIYNALLNIHPSYYECHLRLACMYMDVGDVSNTSSDVTSRRTRLKTYCE